MWFLRQKYAYVVILLQQLCLGDLCFKLSQVLGAHTSTNLLNPANKKQYTKALSFWEEKKVLWNPAEPSPPPFYDFFSHKIWLFFKG